MQKALRRGPLIIMWFFLSPRQPNTEGSAKGYINYHVNFFYPPDSLMQKAMRRGRLIIM